MGNLGLHPGWGGPDTEMDPLAKSEMVVGFAPDGEDHRLLECGRVQVSRADHDIDRCARPDRRAADFDIGGLWSSGVPCRTVDAPGYCSALHVIDAAI